MQNGYDFQSASNLALYIGHMCRQDSEKAPNSGFSQTVKSEAFSEEVR